MRRQVLVVMLGLWICASVANAQRKYDFVIAPADSQMDVNVSLQAFTGGTLIGNYDPDTNPSGTRTKPGMYPFGFSGNFPVPVEVKPTVSGNVTSQPAGGFSMVVHPDANTVILMNYVSDLLPSRTATLPASADVVFDTFTTRSPDSIYPGGTYNVPLGEVVVQRLNITQTDEPAVGTLTPLGGNRYAFAVAPIVTLYVYAELQGTVLETTSNPNPLALVGEIEIHGETATVLSVNTIDWSDVDNPNQPIPRFAMDLPTVLPAGNTAHLLFDLTLNEVRSSVNGNYTIAADGTLGYRTVRGTIALGDYSASVAGMNVPVDIRPIGENTPVETHIVALSPAGEYQFDTALWGRFDLSAKGSHWLRQTVKDVSLEKDAQVDFALTNGDVDGDNEVTLLDFSALIAAFGSLPDDAHWNPDADLDGDEEVSLLDFAILVSNFGAAGDD